MNKFNSIDFLNNCIEKIKNTSIDDYRKIKESKKLNFEEAYNEFHSEEFFLKQNINYTFTYTEKFNMNTAINNSIFSKEDNLKVYNNLSKSA